LLNNGKTLLK